ncbi:MAG: DUF1330 domain-containing protein [Pseudomonadota bacterium]|nr:DUF1330 domain-containing protein [Pseudomonadota bacterium]
MVAYFIADQQEVTNPEVMKTYSAGVAATIEQYGGKFVCRGGDPEVVEGEWPVRRIIILEFSDRAALKSWYDSPEYADLKAMRFSSSRSNAIIVDGT